MVSELGDQDGVIFDFIDDPVLVADPSGPVSGKIVFQGFGFPEALIFISQDVFDKGVDPVQISFIRVLPIQIVFPGMFGKYQLHSASSLSFPLPFVNSSMDSISLFAFFGLCNK